MPNHRNYLAPDQVTFASPDAAKALDFDRQKSIRVNGRSAALHVHMTCLECGEERWVLCGDIRQREAFTGLCFGCRMTGESSPCWSGGRMEREGYIFIRADVEDPILGPMLTGDGYVREHRAVMAKHLGRPLEFWEVVHHKNRSRDDNRIENLDMMTQSVHRAVTALQERIVELERENAILRAEILMLMSD